MIRRAKILEIPEILEITRACSASMIHNGIYQWNQHYPSLSILETDFARKELFVLEEDETLKGLVVISTRMDEEYNDVAWCCPTSTHTYIHRLAVHPRYQGKGYARKLMDFAEAFSREKGCASVRLDTFSQNKGNQLFYEKRGYQKLSDIYFPKQSTHPFHCYELVL